MSKNPYITEEDKQQIVNLWMNYDCTAQAAADRLGIGYSTARKIINEYTRTGAHTPPAGMLPPVEKPEHKSQINEDFDNAVNQMIVESKNEDTKKDTLDTKSDTPNVPNAVIQAVADKIETLSALLSDNLLTIKKMQQDNEKLRSELAVLYGWRAEHEGAEN